MIDDSVFMNDEGTVCVRLNIWQKTVDQKYCNLQYAGIQVNRSSSMVLPKLLTWNRELLDEASLMKTEKSIESLG